MHPASHAITSRTAAIGALVAALVLAGCETAPPRRQTISPIRQAELEHRALDLLKRAAQSDLDLVAAHAMEALVDVAPEEGTPLFRDALDAEQPLTRFAGYISLGRVRACPPRRVIDAGLKDVNERVRLAAAFAGLRCFDDQTRYGPILATALQHRDNPDIRADAAYLIGLLGEPRAKRRLELVVQRDRSVKVAVHAVAALALLGDERSVERLIAYTQGDQVARFIALQTLVELADPRAQEALEIRVSPAEDFMVLRLIAARALGKLGSDAGYDLALRHADPNWTPPDPVDELELMKLRVNAALALGAIGRESALPTLEKLAQSNDPRIQVAACYAILQIIDDAQLPFPNR